MARLTTILVLRPIALLYATIIVLQPAVSRCDESAAGPNEFIKLRIGDSVEAVQKALGTVTPPEPVQTPSHPGARRIRLLDHGVWVFFGTDGRAYTFRFDAPFAGAIKGVRIAESRDEVVQALGESAPLNRPVSPAAHMIPVQYRLTDGTRLGIQYDGTDHVSVIFVFAGTISFRPAVGATSARPKTADGAPPSPLAARSRFIARKQPPVPFYPALVRGGRQVPPVDPMPAMGESCRPDQVPDGALRTARPVQVSLLQLERARARSLTSGGLFSVAWSPDSKFLGAKSVLGAVEVRSASTLSLLCALSTGPRGDDGLNQHSVAFSADGRSLLSGRLVAMRWSIPNWKLVQILVGPSASEPQPFGIFSVAFAKPADDRVIVAYQSIPTIARLGRPPAPVIAYRMSDSTEAWAWTPPATVGAPRVTGLADLKDQDALALATIEYRPSAQGDPQRLARVWIMNARTGAVLHLIDHAQFDRITAIAATADGKLLATATTTGSFEAWLNPKTGHHGTLDNRDPIRIWNARTGDLVSEIPVSLSSTALAFTPDDTFLVASQEPSPRRMVLRIWNLKTGALSEELQAPPEVGEIMDLRFSPRGDELAVVGAGFAIYRYRTGR